MFHLDPKILELIITNQLELNNLNRRRIPSKDNLTSAERTALQQLSQNRDIVIKLADKGSTIVIMDRQQYLFEANRQLQNQEHYRELTKSNFPGF